MVIEHGCNSESVGFLDTLDISNVYIGVDDKDRIVKYIMSGHVFYIRPSCGGYIIVNGVKITDTEAIVRKLGELMMLERGLGIPDEKPRVTRRRKTQVKTV